MILERLTPEAFAPFGQTILAPSSAPDAHGPGWSWWAETGLLPAAARDYAAGYLALEPAPLAFDWAERHERSAELVVPLDGECAVYVGLSDWDPDPDAFRVFRVRPGQGVILAPRVWHGAPLALDRPLAALVLLQRGTGADDTTVVRFPAVSVANGG